MDFQHREGSTGSATMASAAETNMQRRERLRKLAMETIDLSKDPYFMKNHLGSYECRLCLTIHINEGYLSHTQGKKHQANLSRRAAKEAAFSGAVLGTSPAATKLELPKKRFIKIGRPGYQLSKRLDSKNNRMGFLLQIQYPQIAMGIEPLYRVMSSFEQKAEPADRAFQYLVIAAEPYETIAFRLPSQELCLDKEDSDSHYLVHWDPRTKHYSIPVFQIIGLDQ